MHCNNCELMRIRCLQQVPKLKWMSGGVVRPILYFSEVCFFNRVVSCVFFTNGTSRRVSFVSHHGRLSPITIFIDLRMTWHTFNPFIFALNYMEHPRDKLLLSLTLCSLYMCQVSVIQVAMGTASRRNNVKWLT